MLAFTHNLTHKMADHGQTIYVGDANSNVQNMFHFMDFIGLFPCDSLILEMLYLIDCDGALYM